MATSSRAQSDAADARAHAVTNPSPGEPAPVAELVDRIVRSPRGALTHVVVVVPPDAASSVPGYDLAMGMSDELSRRDRRDAADLVVVTPERTPEEVLERLARGGIRVLAGRVAGDWAWGRLLLDDETAIPADRVIGMPSRPR